VQPEPVRRRRPLWRSWAVLSLTCWGLLGQGERCEVDPRFGTPGATLATYWEALRADDGATVLECFLDPRQAVPFPGMLWFLPPSVSVSVSSIQYSAGDEDALVATYEVRFLPVGAEEEMSAITSSELVRFRGEWRILRAAGEVGLPDWQPIPHRFDI
jgi:hypothetical protein